MKVAPSLLSADFSRLEEEVKAVEKAEYIHLDIMDGHFVPNITFGPMVVKALRPKTKQIFDVHLMIENPDLYIGDFAKAGADIITVHVEATKHLHRTIQLIKSHNVLVGVALNPHTPIDAVMNILHMTDLVLVMSVNPGFGGQSFIDFTLDKIKQLKDLKEKNNYHYEIEVDGGINDKTAKLCLEKGADVLVAGSYIFNNENREEAIGTLRL